MSAANLTTSIHPPSVEMPSGRFLVLYAVFGAAISQPQQMEVFSHCFP